ncbi:MAG: hypothetical protein WBD44_05225 [Phycisphaerae bacterium]
MYDKWNLIQCEITEWKQDESRLCCIINALQETGKLITGLPKFSRLVGLNILTSDHTPAISFEGRAHDVRICAMRYAEKHGWGVSLEHAAYLGSELTRAAMLGKDYIQD